MNLADKNQELFEIKDTLESKMTKESGELFTDNTGKVKKGISKPKARF